MLLLGLKYNLNDATRDASGCYCFLFHVKAKLLASMLQKFFYTRMRAKVAKALRIVLHKLQAPLGLQSPVLQAT